VSLSCEETISTPDLVAEEKLQRGRQWQERDRGYEVDELWERVRPLIPECPPQLRGGRPSEEDWQMLWAILSVLRTGIQWHALPRELGACTTAYDRFRRMASSKASLIAYCKQDYRNMTNWRGLPGNGKAWMG
jgi:hypothetical protein